MTSPTPWATWALGAAMVAAGVLAARETTRVADAHRALPDGVAARVGTMLVSDDELERAATALSRDRREGTLRGDREHVLERLIDEALLVQLALDQGLAHRDPRTRADLTAAALQLLVSEAELEEPSEAQLRAFYAERQGELRAAPRVEVERRFARGPDAQTPERGAATSRCRSTGEEQHGPAGLREAPPSAPDLCDEVLDTPPLPLPTGWLSERDLREVFGAGFAAQLMTADEGRWLPPLERDGGLHHVRVLRRETPAAPPLDEVRDEVLAMYRRARGDDAVRAYLERARLETSITRRDLADEADQ